MANELTTRYQAILAANGISEDDVKPADIELITTQDFDGLMVPVPGSELKFNNGVVQKRASGVTNPLILLGLKFQPSKKFEPTYTGYYTVGVLDTVSGKQTVITVSRPANDADNALGADLEQMHKGNIFRVAHIDTQAGNKVFRCVPLE